MADHNECSFVFVDGLSDNRDVTEIYMVGWFIEDEEIRSLENESCIAEESFLSFRK